MQLKNQALRKKNDLIVAFLLKIDIQCYKNDILIFSVHIYELKHSENRLNTLEMKF